MSAFVPGFESDLFISYAHQDDNRLPLKNLAAAESLRQLRQTANHEEICADDQDRQ